MKTYTASTNISINIVLRNGLNMRISFSPLTDGRSVLYTSDEEIQWGLEHHYKFGKLFTLDNRPKIETSKPAKKANKQPAKRKSASRKDKAPTVEIAEVPAMETVREPHDDASAEIADNENLDTENFGIDDTVDDDASETDDTVDDETSDDETTVISVSDPDAAKDYLADKFGISRTKLKTCEIIEATARDLGIAFNYN